MKQDRNAFVALGFLLGILLIAAFVSACSSSEQEALSTMIAPAAETAMAEGKKFAATEGTELISTGQVVAQTQISSARETAVPRAVTEIARQLTPDPLPTPKLDANDIATYTVEPGDNLTKIAAKFSIPLDDLIQLNLSRYLSLASDPNHVEAGWVLIVASGTGSLAANHPTPAPTVQPTALPECNVQTVYWISGDFKCEEYRLDAVTEVGVSIGCVVLDDNPLGYYKTHTIYDGWVIIVNGKMISYGWFVDREKNQTVIGPAIIRSKQNYMECGIPNM
jgi:hypothetical protein